MQPDGYPNVVFTTKDYIKYRDQIATT